MEVAKDDFKHQDYKHVTELAVLYKQLLTGQNLDDLIRQFNTREDDNQFKQRKQLTVLVTPAITHKLITPERKITTAQTIAKEFYYDKDDEAKRKRLTEVLGEFYNGGGVDRFLSDVFLDLYDTDPNAFMLFLFNNYDNRIETPVIYSVTIPSAEAVDYSFVNNELEYLIIKKDIQYKDGESTKKGAYYTIFAKNEQVSFTQVGTDTFAGAIEGRLVNAEGVVEQVQEDATYYLKLGNKLYAVKFYNHNAGRVPAIRVGNIPDIETDGRTCINNWHAAVPYLKKSIKTCSELDLTESLHVFPQVFEYQPKCNGSVVDGNLIPCSGGLQPDGKTCGACNGTGYQSHRSAQDKIVLGLPRSPQDIFDLQKLKTYVSAPIDILDRLIERLETHEKKAIEAVYNSDRFIKSSFAKTATGEQIDYQSIHDSLKRVMERYSDVYRFTIIINAAFNDIADGLQVRHQFGRHLGFETEQDILTKIQMARSANVPPYIISQMNNDLIYVTYADYPDIIRIAEVKQRLFPFDGYDTSTINLMISQGHVPMEDVILYSNFNRIIKEAETTIPQFYSLAPQRQQDIVMGIVQRIRAELESQKPVAISFNEPETKE
jgi:hypothetical protein